MKLGPKFPGVPRSYGAVTKEWILDHAEGDQADAGVYGLYSPAIDDEWHRMVRHAGPEARVGGGAEIRVHKNYAGGPGFDAREWPHVTIRLAFPSGEFELRDKFVEEAKKFIDQFVKDNGMDPV